MRLRIVAGELGGRWLRAPPGERTRPTLERVREAWFSALGDRIAGARVLDLFAGSGALGIEALSRGAALAHFVESDRRAAALLARNLAELGLGPRSRVFRRDVFAFLGPARAPADGEEGGGSREARAYDLALADPPYGGGLAERLVERFRRRPFAAMLCVEHAVGALVDAGATWRRRYGDTALSFFTALGDEADVAHAGGSSGAE